VVARVLTSPRRWSVERRLAAAVLAVAFAVTAIHAPSAIRGVDGETSYYRSLTAAQRGYLEPRAIDLDTRFFDAAKNLLPRSATYYVDVGPKAPPLAASGAPAFAPYVLLPRRRVLDPSQADWVLSYVGDLEALHLSYARVVDLGNGLQIAEVQR